ncbi:Gfo/Idh/MocA family protein [Candidatus Latescibacterota bacterium]
MVRIAIIGTGSMAQTHAENFQEIRGCKIVACSDIVPGRASDFADKNDIPASYENTAGMLDCERLDCVSIVTPDHAHCDAVMQAVEHGLHIMCEKPLADNLENAQKMETAAREKGIITAVNFSYRNSPATQKAAKLVASGKIGRVIHVEGSYLQSWLTSKVWGDWRTTDAWLWRLSTRHGSMGCLGDIGVHLYDLASFITGEITDISCKLKTFDKGCGNIGEYVFDANDSFVSMVQFESGAIGTLHSSRWASGHHNTVALRVYGDKGAIDLNLDRDGDELRGCIGRKALDTAAWKTITCPKVPNMYQRFITAVRTGKQGQTSFTGALKVQSYLEQSMKDANGAS